MKCHQLPRCPGSPGTVYVWVQSLGGVPDEPHAVHVSEKTEGSGVGVRKEPPVGTKTNLPVNMRALTEKNLTTSLFFRITLTDALEVCWETLLVGRKLIVEIPSIILPEGSKESFVTLLEYAEEALRCSHVIVCFKKARSDRACLIRTMMFLGFVVVAPGNPLVPVTGDLMFMAYIIDRDSDDESDGGQDSAT